MQVKLHKNARTTPAFHRPHTINATLTTEQEHIAVIARRLLLLSLDDLLVLIRTFLNPAVSRSGLDRCLRRHGVSNLKQLNTGLSKIDIRRLTEWLNGVTAESARYWRQATSIVLRLES